MLDGQHGLAEDEGLLAQPMFPLSCFHLSLKRIDVLTARLEQQSALQATRP